MSNDHPEKPNCIEPNPEGIPDCLRSGPKSDDWLLWRHEWKPDREEWSKVPKPGDGSGGYIDPTDTDYGVAFTTALETYQTGEYDGLGLITDADDLVVAVDWDDCRDPDRPHDSVPELVADSVDFLNTYTEVSPSGTGYHSFALGAKPEGRNRADLDCPPVLDETPHVEMYDGSGGRYITVTGRAFDDISTTVERRPQELKTIHERMIAESDDGTTTNEAGAEQPSDLDDRELVEKAKSAENGDKFARLWRGNTSGYESHSEADLALCGLLAFWTGGDKSQMARLFRESGLYREKWERDDYRQRTIKKSLRGRSEYYDPDDGDRKTPAHAKPSPADDVDGADDGEEDNLNWAYVREVYGNEGNDWGRYYAAEVLNDRYAWMSVVESETLWVYDQAAGYYSPWGEKKVASLLEQNLGTHYSRSEQEEILARLSARHQTHREELNARTRDGHYLCVGNGVVDLETGELLDHDPAYKFTRGLEWDYDPERADREPILDFLDDVTLREADRDTLLDHLAHGLMPGHPYRAFVVTYGPGSNGKTQMGKLFRGFVGEENAASVELQDLTGDDSFATGGLPGAFVNVGDDVSVSEIRDVSILKSLTGAGTVRANEKYEKQYEFENEAAMFFSANEPPRISEESAAVGDRLYPIKMPYRFVSESEYNPNDELQKLKTPGISRMLLGDESAMMGLLSLCVEHAQRLIESNGQYSMPEGPTERREMYEAASDPIRRFAIRQLEQGGQNDILLKDDAYDVYTALCGRENERVANEQVFKRQISQLSGVIDVESGRTRQLSPGDEQETCWRYATFSDSAKDLMPDRLLERYFDGDGDDADVDSQADDDSRTEASESDAYGAVPLVDAAESPTGYVTTTAEIVSVDTFGDENDGGKAILRDETAAMDIKTWDGEWLHRLRMHEGDTVAIIEAEVYEDEYDDTRKLAPVEGLTRIEEIQQGVGHTEAADSGDGQASLADTPDEKRSEEELPELESPQQMIERAIEIINQEGGEIERPKLLHEMDMQPQKAKAVIEKGLQRGDLIKTPDGEICHD